MDLTEACLVEELDEVRVVGGLDDIMNCLLGLCGAMLVG